MNDIFEPLVLARGSHKAGSGQGCAMNVISWENGDTQITDYPACSDPFLARLVQQVNDMLADDETGLLSPANSLIALDLGHQTVGTSSHGLIGNDYSALLALTVRPFVDQAIADVEANPYDGSTEDLDTLTSIDYSILAGKYHLDEEEASNYAQYTLGDAEMIHFAANYPTSHADRIEYRVQTARKVIARFKELTGVESPTPDQNVTAQAVERMRVVAS